MRTGSEPDRGLGLRSLRPQPRPGMLRAFFLGDSPKEFGDTDQRRSLTIRWLARCPRGAVWSARLTVKEKVTGSNPVGGALRVVFLTAVCRTVALPFVRRSAEGSTPSTPIHSSGSLVYRFRTSAPQAEEAGSTPARAASSDRNRRVAEWQTRESQKLVPRAGVGVQVSPRRLDWMEPSHVLGSISQA
jgi:hypothetical protein